MNISKNEKFKELFKSLLKICKEMETCKYKPELYQEVPFTKRCDKYRASLNELIDYIDEYVVSKTKRENEDGN